jgi:hypothetical protein
MPTQQAGLNSQRGYVETFVRQSNENKGLITLLQTTVNNYNFHVASEADGGGFGIGVSEPEASFHVQGSSQTVTSGTVSIVVGSDAAQVDDVTLRDDVGGDLNNTYWYLYSAKNATAYVVWYNVAAGGTNPYPNTASSVIPATTIEVSIGAGISAAAVATATQAAIDAAASADFTIPVPVGDTLTITQTANGYATAPTDGNVGGAWATFQTTAGVSACDVVGNNTTFASTLKGAAITIDSTTFTVFSVMSATRLALTSAAASSLTSVPYTIDGNLFRVDGANSNSYIVVGNTGRVGIGTISPECALHLTQPEADAKTEFCLQNTRTDLVASEEAATIIFKAGASGILGRIAAFTEDTSENVGGISIYGYDGANYNCGVQVDSNGAVTFGSGITFPLGIEASPGISFDGDSNTGLWGTGSDVLAVSTAGTERARFLADGTLLINQNVSGPSTLGQVRVNGDITCYPAGITGGVNIGRFNGTLGAPAAINGGEEIGVLRFIGYDGTTTASGIDIRASASEAWSNPSNTGCGLDFYTTLTGTSGSQLAMSLSNERYLGLGTNAPTARIHLTGDDIVALTGTVTVGAGTAAVTGAGTAFLSELYAGSSITIGVETHTVLSIANDTNLTLDANHTAGATGVAATTDSRAHLFVTSDSLAAYEVKNNGSIWNNESIITTKHIDIAAGGPIAALYRTRGSHDAPTTTVNGDTLGTYIFSGHDGTSNVSPGACIVSSTTENWNGAAHGASLSLCTVANGGTALVPRLVVDNDGDIALTGATYVGHAGEFLTLDALGNITTITEASIDHANIQNIGTNTHAQIDDHIADPLPHRQIDDLATGQAVGDDEKLWSANKIYNELGAIVDGLSYQGMWNAETNTPPLASGVGTQGHYYVVCDACDNLALTLDGITSVQGGDWVVFSNTGVWQKIINTTKVSSVANKIGAVLLNTADVSEDPSNLYFTQTRVSANNDVADNSFHRLNRPELHRVIDDITPSGITLYSGTKIESLVSTTAAGNQLINTTNPTVTLRDSDGVSGTSTGNLVFINGDDEKEVSSLRVNNLDTSLRNTQTNGQIILDNGPDHKVTMNAGSTTTFNHPVNTGNLDIDQSTAPVLNLTDNDAILGDGSDITATINFNDAGVAPGNNYGKVQYSGGNLDISNFSATGKLGLSCASGNSNIQIDQTPGQVDINSANTNLSGNLSVLNGNVDITGVTNNLNVYSTVALAPVSVNAHIDDLGIHRRVVDAPNGSATQLWSSLYTKERIDAIPRGLEFQALWDASAMSPGGSPNILAGTKLNGYYWIVSVSGSKDLNGTGAVTYAVGDWVIYSDNQVDPAEYQKLDNTDNINDAGPPSATELYSSQKIEDRLNDNIVINDPSPLIQLEDSNALVKSGVRTEIQMNTNNSVETASRIAQTINGLELINDIPNIQTSTLSLLDKFIYNQAGTPVLQITNSLASTPQTTSGFINFADNTGTVSSRIRSTGGNCAFDTLLPNTTMTLSANSTNMVMSSGTNRTLFNHAIESTADLTLPGGSVNGHITDATKHFLIDDGSIGTDIVWSADKINTEVTALQNNRVFTSVLNYVSVDKPFTSGTLINTGQRKQMATYLPAPFNRFVVIAGSGSVIAPIIHTAPSADPTNWTQSTGIVNAIQILYYNYAYSPTLQRFVIATAQGSSKVNYSDDGALTFTDAGVTGTSSNNWINLFWGNDRFVMTSNVPAGGVGYSTNGITWTTYTQGSAVLNMLRYSTSLGLWITGDNNNIYYSTDATSGSWTAGVHPGAGSFSMLSECNGILSVIKPNGVYYTTSDPTLTTWNTWQVYSPGSETVRRPKCLIRPGGGDDVLCVIGTQNLWFARETNQTTEEITWQPIDLTSETGLVAEYHNVTSNETGTLLLTGGTSTSTALGVAYTDWQAVSSNYASSRDPSDGITTLDLGLDIERFKDGNFSGVIRIGTGELYEEGGALKWKGGSGTITTIAPA